MLASAGQHGAGPSRDQHPGQPEIFPVIFVVECRTVPFRTAEGTKLFSAVMNNRAAFEADEHNVVEDWSVIVKARRRC